MIGYPLEHSFSPSYFSKKFIDQHIFDCDYKAYPLRSISELNTLITDNPELLGLNVTIPYKQSVLEYVHELDSVAKQTGSVNCIKINRSGSSFYLTGYNTDVMGFERSLVPLLKSHHRQALILGWGGSARSIKYVLEKLCIKTQVVSRSQTMFQYQDIDDKIMSSYHIIINTTPVGMFPNTGEVLKFPYQYITSDHLCYDLIYNPEITSFLSGCQEGGGVIKNGLEMLTLQAEESWKIWNP